MKDLKHTTKAKLNEQIDELRKSLQAERLRYSALSHDHLELVKVKGNLVGQLSTYQRLADERFKIIEELRSRSIFQALKAWWRAL